MKLPEILLLGFAFMLGVGSFWIFSNLHSSYVTEEKIVFKHDEKSQKSDPVANLNPNGILCINIPALSVMPKQEIQKEPVKK